MSKDNIQTLKMINGEDIVVTVLEQGDIWTVKDGVVMHPVPAGENQMQVAILPYLPYSDEMDSFELKAQHIVVCTDPSEEILAQYNSVFNPNKIITPPKPKLVL